MKRLFLIPCAVVCSALFLMTHTAYGSDFYGVDLQSRMLMYASNTDSAPGFRPEISNTFRMDSGVPFFAAGNEGRKKSPGVALVLSLLIPGAGQMYNGQVLKGFGFMGAYLGGWVVAVAGAISSVDDTFNIDDQGNLDISNPSGGSSAMIYAGLGIMAGMYIWSGVDAWNTSKRINSEFTRGLSLYQNDRTGKALYVSLNPTVTRTGQFRSELALKAAF